MVVFFGGVPKKSIRFTLFLYPKNQCVSLDPLMDVSWTFSLRKNLHVATSWTNVLILACIGGSISHHWWWICDPGNCYLQSCSGSLCPDRPAFICLCYMAMQILVYRCSHVHLTTVVNLKSCWHILSNICSSFLTITIQPLKAHNLACLKWLLLNAWRICASYWHETFLDWTLSPHCALFKHALPSQVQKQTMYW